MEVSRYREMGAWPQRKGWGQRCRYVGSIRPRMVLRAGEQTRCPKRVHVKRSSPRTKPWDTLRGWRSTKETKKSGEELREKQERAGSWKQSKESIGKERECQLATKSNERITTIWMTAKVCSSTARLSLICKTTDTALRKLILRSYVTYLHV